MKKLILISLLTVLYLGTQAQELSTPSFSYSKKKPSYVTLNDGKEIEGTIDKVIYKKGQIAEVRIIDKDGNKQKLMPADIKFMYLPPSGFDNMTKALDKAGDLQKWGNDDLNQGLLGEGYAYFESTTVKIKKKEYTLIMQLLNPTFCKHVKVFHDPYAGETASVGVGGVKLAGGLAKSYFVKRGDQPAYKLTKKDYKKGFAEFWKDCKELANTSVIQWSELTEHIIKYSECVE